MLILGLESSCDDTAVGIVQNGKKILANVRASPDEHHQDFGGVMPEVASRKHLELFLPTLNQALKEAQISLADLDAIAVTNQPGLLGSLLIGVEIAKSLAYLLNKPPFAYQSFTSPFLCLRNVSGNPLSLYRLTSIREDILYSLFVNLLPILKSLAVL